MDELLIKKMPYSADAEAAVIGAMIIDSECIPQVFEIISIEDFYVDENRKIFETIYSMWTLSEIIDPVTLLEKLKTSGLYDDSRGRSYISQLIDITPTAANVKEYAEIVRDKSLLRSLAHITSEIYEASITGADEAQNILENAEQKIYSLRKNRDKKGLTHIKTIILDSYNQLNELALNGGKMPGIDTGFSDLNNFLGGLNNSDLILIAARPGMGKTSFALNIAQNAALKTKKDVAIFNLEMSKEQLVLRLLSSEALIDLKRLRSADLNDDEWSKLADSASMLGGSSMYIDDSSNITVAEIKAKCRRLGENLGLIIIDYLQLMQSGKRSENRVNEVAEISRSLKIMAKELNVPVVCLSQLSRAPEARSDKRPMLSDLRDSGAIEQDADIVMFLYRDDYYDENSPEKNICECMIAKNRHGSTGTIKMQWLGQFTRFTSQEKYHNA